MTRPIVRCRCGHRVLAKEVLRTDLYERPSGREYVYVKYRCKRCKRLGETFVAESRWDWRIFEAARNEMSEAETEVFSDQAPISAEEILAFHCQLAEVEQASDLGKSETREACDEAPTATAKNDSAETSAPESSSKLRPEALRPEALRPEAKRDFKGEAKNETKGDAKAQPGRDESTQRNHPQREN